MRAYFYVIISAAFKANCVSFTSAGLTERGTSLPQLYTSDSVLQVLGRTTAYVKTCIKTFVAPEGANDVTSVSADWGWRLQAWQWKEFWGRGVKKKQAYQTKRSISALVSLLVARNWVSTKLSPVELHCGPCRHHVFDKEEGLLLLNCPVTML